jgi:3-isopropylmalate/(R)-2-methylmalate dehydratase large subunit
MLHLLSLLLFKEGGGIGKVLEYAGEGLAGLPLDERATLANMSVEAGGFTGLMEADERVIEALAALRGLGEDELRALVVRADPDARYAHRLELELGAVEPMVALPGDPRQGVPLRTLGPVPIDIAYGGSCTGGKRADLDMYAAVLRAGLARGRRVAQGVAFYVQFGSQAIRRHAEAMGYLPVFDSAGAVLLEPSCGACIRAGPGVSTRAGQVTVSAVNRNYPGRSGPGSVYLASPFVVAASALLGRLAGPDELSAPRGRSS